MTTSVQHPAPDIPPLGISMKAALTLIDALSPTACSRYEWNQVRYLLSSLLVGGHPMFIDTPSRPMIRGRVFPIKEPGSYAVAPPGSLEQRLSHLGPRQPAEVSDFGRCHLPRSSTFYASFSEETVLEELRPSPGDLVYLIYCRPKLGESFRSTTVGEIDHVRRTGDGSIFPRSNLFIQKIIEWLANLSTEDHYARLVVDAFLADFIRRPCSSQSDYRTVSALAGVLLETSADYSGKFEALYYPSIAFRGGHNIALSYECYSTKVEAYEAKILHVVNHFGHGVYRSRVVASSNNLDKEADKISWTATSREVLQKFPRIDIR